MIITSKLSVDPGQAQTSDATNQMQRSRGYSIRHVCARRAKLVRCEACTTPLACRGRMHGRGRHGRSDLGPYPWPRLQADRHLRRRGGRSPLRIARGHPRAVRRRVLVVHRCGRSSLPIPHIAASLPCLSATLGARRVLADWYAPRRDPRRHSARESRFDSGHPAHQRTLGNGPYVPTARSPSP